MSFVSYAQNYEDVILWRALCGVEQGFYVDVGAADPDEYSVTRAFYERGWSGINIEPLDDYFSKLTNGRQRDTNLKLAVGRTAGLRTLYAFPGTGLSTFDPQIALRHQGAGFRCNETVVPVLTLSKILEDCGAPVIHFLKIDVEGAEGEVLEGLDLDQLRPWIIVVEATEPLSKVSTRDGWEYLVTSKAYSFVYFDGLNCFYVADEVSGLKERLAVPPNILDGFVQWPEWSCRRETAALGQALTETREHARGLDKALQAEQAQSTNLREALREEQAQSTDLRNARRAELAQIEHLLGRIHQLEVQLAVPSFDRAVGRALMQLRDAGNRLTGGGLRSLAKRSVTKSIRRAMSHSLLRTLGRKLLLPFPDFSARVYRLAMVPDSPAPKRPLKLLGAGTTPYAKWISERENENICSLNSSHPESSSKIRISFLVACTDLNTELSATLQSIREQTTQQWELILGTPPDANEKLLQYIQKLSVEEPRFVHVNASSASKACMLCDLLPASAGDFIAFLDPGDVLSPFAVAEIEAELLYHPDADIFYSDEDMLSASRQREQPFFKPEWSPELLYAFNYFGRLTALKRELVIQVGGVSGDMGCAVEWDLNLRLTESSPVIRRISKVLCHRPLGSDRDRPSPRSATSSLHRKAIKKFWATRGIEADVESQNDGTQRSVWEIVDPPLVSIIIPNKNQHALLRVCMNGIVENTVYKRKEIIIVDNSSDDSDTVSFYRELEQRPDIRIVHYDDQFNYSAVCNYGASYANGELLLFLNNDVEVLSSDWLTEMVRFAMRPGVGVVGTKLVYPTGGLQHAGVVLGIHLCGLVFRNAPINEWGVFGSPSHPRNYLAIMGACQLVRREVFARVGGFDESYQVANSDVAICLHAWRAGYRIAYTPFASLVHHEGASRGYHNPIQDMQRTAADIRRLGFADDPYFHPELSSSNPVPTLRANGDVSTKEKLQRDVANYLSSAQPAKMLDLYDDQEIQDATELAREELLWVPQRADEINDCWSAARYCIDLLRTRFDLRLRFSRALSAGTASDFLKWVTTTGGDEYLLSNEARDHLKAAFEKRLSARVRQIYSFRDDLKTNFPTGLTPVGQRELFRWFMLNRRIAGKLRLEEIWWFFLECAEDPAGELVSTYLFNPKWQRAYPDGLTVFGRHALGTWLAATLRISDSWVNPDEWPVDMTAAQQIRLAYQTHGDWQRKHPDGLTTADGAHALLTWLTTPDACVTEDAREWCSKVDIACTAAALFTPGTNIIGHFCYPSGLRTSVEAIRDGLRQAGVAVSLRDIRTDQNDDSNHTDYTGMEFYDTTILHTQPEPFFDEVFQRADLFERTPRTYRIGYWYWELDTIPESWLKQWNLIDEVWAATQFVTNALRQRFDGRVHTMFPGIQIGKYQPRKRSDFGLPDKHEFTFLFVFHMMSVMERKNPLGLIHAFKQAFSVNEPVRLVLKASFGDRHPDSMQEIYSSASTSNITVIDQVFSQDETLSLIDACDAYVSLHRSEGLGLTMAEAMLLGKPVIGTRYSGNIDFMDDKNSLLVDFQLVRLGRPIPPYDANSQWAEPSLDHAAALMRQVYENRIWAAELGARAKADAQTRMSLETAGRRMAARLSKISEERRKR